MLTTSVILVRKWREDVDCKQHAQWSRFVVVESNRRSAHSNLTVPLHENGLWFLVEGGVFGSVDFVGDDALVNDAYVDLYLEYDPEAFGKTKVCKLENGNDNTGGVAIFVSGSSGRRRFSLVSVWRPNSMC